MNRTNRVEKEFTLYGHEFKVLVDEKDDMREVLVFDEEQRKKHGHSYIIHKDKREARSGGIIRSAKELPPRDEHVSQVTNDGIQKWLRKESEEKSFEQEVEDAIDATAELWRKQFTKAEDFRKS